MNFITAYLLFSLFIVIILTTITFFFFYFFDIYILCWIYNIFQIENLKSIIVLEKNIEGYWNEKHDKTLWQFVMDSESCIITVFFLGDVLFVQCSIPPEEINELFYIIKVSSEKLVSADYAQKLLYGSAKAPFFESLYDILNIVYEPMFSKNSDWSKCILLMFFLLKSEQVPH